MKKLLLLSILLCSFAASVSSQSYPADCYPEDEMLVARYAHTMTEDQDLVYNQIEDYLFAGGYDAGGALSTAEYNGGLYQMNEAHADHTAELLNDGRIIIIAGYNGQINLTSIESFDTETLEFTTVADLAVGRSFHRSVLLQDGRVLITGGFDGNVNLTSCEIFNPITNEVEEAASMNFARSSHTCNILQDGRVIVTGGFNPDNGFQQTSCEMYDPITNTWQNIASLNSGRDNHAAALYSNASLVVSGGRYYNAELNLFEGQKSVEVYNLQTDSWEISFPENSQSLSYHKLHGWSDGALLVITPGGIANSGIDVEFTYSSREEFFFGWGSPGLTSSLNPNTPWYAVYDNNPGYLYASAITLFSPDMILYYSGGLKTNGVSNEIVSCYISVSSIPEIELPPLKIYPIPATDVATVEWGTNADYVLNVYDLNGKLVATQKGRDSKAQVAELPSGNYIAHVTIGENTIFGNLSFR